MAEPPRADYRAFTCCDRSQPASGSGLRISLLDLAEPCGRHVFEPANEQHAIRGMAGLPSWICRYLYVQVARSGNNVDSPVGVTDSPPSQQNFFPAIDVSPKTGAIKIIYYTNKLSGFFLDVFVAESSDGGATFINSRVTTTSFNPNGASVVPTPVIGDYIDVSIVPTQNFIAVWMDTRTGAQTIFAGNLAP